MEQQTVSIAKSGITTTLNCRSTMAVWNVVALPETGMAGRKMHPIEDVFLIYSEVGG